MNTKAQGLLEAAFVLHGRSFRESSLLIEAWVRSRGRFPLVARGMRRPRSPWQAILQPFVPLLMSWAGRGEVLTLTAAERAGAGWALAGEAIACGFYLNELLLRMLPRNDPHEGLFDRYAETLEGLTQSLRVERILRIFERDLLRDLGYGLSLEREAESGAALDEQTLYSYDPERGPVVAGGDERRGIIVRGSTLVSLRRGQLDDPQCLRELKALMRAVLAPHLGPKPLNSRALLRGTRADGERS
jgi:DNA repair protein RecO (recombination protein O)